MVSRAAAEVSGIITVAAAVVLSCVLVGRRTVVVSSVVPLLVITVVADGEVMSREEVCVSAMVEVTIAVLSN